MCVFIGDAGSWVHPMPSVLMNHTIVHYWSHYMVRQFSRVAIGALVLGFAACDQSTGPSTGITQADANQLAVAMDAALTLGVSGTSVSTLTVAGGTSSVAAEPSTFRHSVDVTAPCPKGGTLKLVGTADATSDFTARNFSLHVVGTRTDTDCGFDTREGVLRLTGSIAFDGSLNIVNGALSGLQTQTHDGSFHWVRGAESGDCAIKLTSTFDPATHIAAVKGNFCGMDVNVTRTRGS